MRSILWPQICWKCVCRAPDATGGDHDAPRPPSWLGVDTLPQSPPHLAPRPPTLGTLVCPPTHNLWLRHCVRQFTKDSRWRMIDEIQWVGSRNVSPVILSMKPKTCCKLACMWLLIGWFLVGALLLFCRTRCSASLFALECSTTNSVYICCC